VELDIAIVGAGPAGLNMGRAAGEAGAKYKILEKDRVAGAWRKLHPDMRMLSPATPQLDWTSLPGLDIWKVGCERPFPTRSDFIRYLEAYAEHFNLEVEEGVEVLSVRKNENGHFQLATDRGNYTCRRLVAATGIISNPYIPEPLRGKPNVIHSVDYRKPEDFEGRRVLVAGCGNSAAEMIINIAGWADEVIWIHPGKLMFHSESRRAEHIRGHAEGLVKEMIQFGLVRHLPECAIEDFDGKTAAVNGTKVEVDAVISATGYRPHLSFLENSDLNIKLRGDYPALNMRLESSTEPGLFFTGSLNNVFPFSSFIHGFREDPDGMDLNPDAF